MKRFFFSLIALSAAAIGCTQSALVEAPDLLGTEISFSPYTGRTPVTKASSIAQPDDQGNLPAGVVTLAASGGFNIFCYLNNDTEEPYMNGRLVTSSDQGATWSYGSPVLYWPDPSSPSTLSFVAYSANASDYLTNNDTGTSFTFTVPEDVENQVDLLATALQKDLTLNNTPSGSVSLHFKHLLSRVGFKVKATKENNRDITISALTFSGTMPVSGSLNFLAAEGSATPKLAVSTSESLTTYDFLSDPVEFASDTDPVQVVDDENGTYMMIMPHKVTRTFDHKISVTYQVTGMQNPKTAVVDLPSGFEFKPNTAYEFILSIATSAISFSVEETDWTNDTNVSENYPLEPVLPDPVEVNGVKVSRTTATVILNVTNDEFDEVGVVYMPSSSQNWDAATTKSTTVSRAGTYELNIDGLAPDTEYICRAFSKIGNETVIYGSETEYKVFRTQGAVAMEPIDNNNIMTYTATVSATYVGELSTITEQGFCLSEGNETPNLSNSVKLDGSPAEAFSVTFTGLKPITDYSCCAYVKNNKGVVTYSEPVKFTTAPNLGPEPGTDSGSNYDPVDPEKPEENKPGSDNIDPWEGEEDGDGDGEDDGVVDFE